MAGGGGRLAGRGRRGAEAPLLDERRGLYSGISTITAASTRAKLLLRVTDFRTFRATPAELLHRAREGGVFYGGLILAVLVSLWYIRRVGLPLWTTCDVFAPGIALGPRSPRGTLR